MARPLDLIRRLEDNVGRALVGKPEVVRLAVVGLLARGHLLIEDVPGVGKTTLAAALARSIGNSFFVSILSTLITVPLAFVYAYALTRSCAPGRGLFKTIALIPILVPSLLPGIALVYLFGNQGLLKSWIAGGSIYGPAGVIASSIMWTFPHAVLIILASLLNADRRLYQAAAVLNAGTWRTFANVTWPSCRYGVVTALLSVFVMVFTDFGIAKVIGGNFNLLATDIYKEVVGLQNFGMGAVV